MPQMKATFPDYIEIGKPFTVHVSNGEDLADVLTYIDDIYYGSTDQNGDIVIKLDREIHSYYHPGLRTELLIMLGYDLGYYMLFLDLDEYRAVNNNPGDDDIWERPITGLSLLKQEYALPPNIHDFMTLFDPSINMKDGSQIAMKFSVERGIKEYYNDANSHRYHQHNMGKLWHELGHDSVGMWHDMQYSVLPDHGGGHDLNGLPAYACIMCQNQWTFCPKCRNRLRAVNPSVHNFMTTQEKRDMAEKYLYWFFEEDYDAGRETYVLQIHQPQEQTSNVPRP